MKINGIEGMSRQDVQSEIERGGKFVFYQYCISLFIITFKRPTDIYFVKSGESAVAKGLPYVGLSLLMGWWGIPWGPIYTVTSLVTNFKGGKDVTDEVLRSIPG